MTKLDHLTDTHLTLTSTITDWQLGESVAVNGCCLTVVAFEHQTVSFVLSAETMRATHFEQLHVGDTVNLERALKVGERMGGHFVTGHVDQVTSLDEITPENDCYILSFQHIAPQHLGLIVPKGSICINGVSLTINSVSDRGFEVCIIPHTWAVTQLQYLKINQAVNLEFDYLAKLVLKQQSRAALYLGGEK